MPEVIRFIQRRGILFVVILFLYSCTVGGDGKVSLFKDDSTSIKELPIIDRKSFFVDSTTNWMAVYPQVIELNGICILSSLNIVDNSLKLYDLNTGNLYRSLVFYKEGPNKLPAFLSVHIISLDSILYLDKVSNLYLLDKDLKIQKRFNIKDDKQKGSPLFYDNVLPLVRLSRNEFVSVNYFTTRRERKLNLKIDLEKASIEYFNKPPINAVDGFYGLEAFGEWNYAFNRKDSTFIFNFPSLDSLLFFDVNFKLINKVEARSQLQQGKIKKVVSQNLESEPPDYRLDKEETIRRIKGSFVYTDLLFNSQKNQYYRFVGLPISDHDINLNDPVKSEVRKYNLIVLDKKYRLIGEYNIPFNKYLIHEDSFFIYQGKLYLQLKIEDEDQMYFDVIEF